jgi:hypothetical protein
MDYLSFSKDKAYDYQDKFGYLEGKVFTYFEDKKQYTVTGILVSPSDPNLLREFTSIVSQCDMGVKNMGELTKFKERLDTSAFTAVLFARRDSPHEPGHIFLPLTQMVNNSGELEVGFAM